MWYHADVGDNWSVVLLSEPLLAAPSLHPLGLERPPL